MTQPLLINKIRYRIFPWFVFIFLTLGAFVMMMPFVWMILSAFKTDDEILKMPIQWFPSNWLFDNFSRALLYQPILTQMLNTFILAALKIGGEVFVSAGVAYGFARFKFKGKNVLFMILLATMMLPYEVTMIPTFIFWGFLGLTDSYVPLVLPAYFGSAAFIFFLKMYFETFPKEIDESAIMDGASPFLILWHIYLPLAKPALITITLWSFMGTWNDLLGQLIYITSDSLYTVQLGLASFSSLTGQTLWGPLMAASALALIPILILLLYAQKYFIEGIKTTGIK